MAEVAGSSGPLICRPWRPFLSPIFRGRLHEGLRGPAVVVNDLNALILEPSVPDTCLAGSALPNGGSASSSVVRCFSVRSFQLCRYLTLCLPPRLRYRRVPPPSVPNDAGVRCRQVTDHGCSPSRTFRNLFAAGERAALESGESRKREQRGGN